MGRSVLNTPELQRILQLPYRNPQDIGPDVWTDVLSRPPRTDCDSSCVCGGRGTMQLRPLQADALSEAAKSRGGLFPIRVGGGKTLLSLLLPWALSSEYPLIILPAALRDKTILEMRKYARHWHMPRNLRIRSYRELSVVNGADHLNRTMPDAIICDEAHYLKNTQAAVTRRVRRYLKENAERCAFVAMSGTIIKRSIRDFAHLSAWALREQSPVPLPSEWHVIDEWSRALDAKVSEERRLEPGALLQFGGKNARDGFRRRLVGTQGVVATSEKPLPIGLRIECFTEPLPSVLHEAFDKLRSDWETPDGWQLCEGIDLWRHARELAAGFYSVWDPRPPEDWARARSDWYATARQILGINRRGIDTEKQLRLAVYAGEYPEIASTLARWESIKDTFEINATPVWVDYSVIDAIAARALDGPPTLIWTERPAIGRALKERHGIPYYGAGDADISAATEPFTATVATRPNSTGKNLQLWSRNVIVDVPPNGAQWEQLLGRTHREGQQASQIDVEVFVGCREDARALRQAIEDGSVIEGMTGQSQKIVQANLISEVKEVDLP